MGQRVLVIGGTGFIGPDVVRGLEERGTDVTVFHSGRHELPGVQATSRHIHGARKELAGLLGALPLGPDVVIDMAPMTAAQSPRGEEVTVDYALHTASSLS